MRFFFFFFSFFLCRHFVSSASQLKPWVGTKFKDSGLLAAGKLSIFFWVSAARGGVNHPLYITKACTSFQKLIFRLVWLLVVVEAYFLKVSNLIISFFVVVISKVRQVLRIIIQKYWYSLTIWVTFLCRWSCELVSRQWWQNIHHYWIPLQL